MATVTSITAGAWHADAATVWDTGTEPGTGDTAIVAHTLTKDDDKGGTADCAVLTINNGGSISIGVGGTLKVTGAASGHANGKIQVNGRTLTIGGALTILQIEATAGATLNIYESGIDSNTMKVGANGIVGTSGSHVTITFTKADGWNAIGSSLGGPLKWIDIIGGGQSTCRFYFWGGIPLNCGPVEDCTFSNFKYNYGMYYGATSFDRCYFYGNEYGLMCPSATSYPPILRNCVFGYDRSLSASANTDSDMRVTEREVAVFLLGCTIDLSKIIVGSQTHILRHADQNGDIGGWALSGYYWRAFRSTASKKTGDYGIEIIQTNSATETYRLPYIDFFIPVETGDTVAPSIYYENVTADMDLEGAANRIVFELDPHNIWGLYEVHDMNGGDDSYTNWRQVSFTGGTAGGTSDSGTVLLRVRLGRYVATGVVYLADLDPGVS